MTILIRNSIPRFSVEFRRYHWPGGNDEEGGRDSLRTEEENQLRIWASGRKHPRRLTERARIVLYAAEGLTNVEIARRGGI